MRVLKFGGSSIATPERIRVVTNIILAAAKEEPIIVVVSAFQGISNQLLTCAQLAADGDKGYEKIFQQISQRHFEIIQLLLPENNTSINETTEALMMELNEILQGMYLLKELTLGALDHISSFGERLSANIISDYIAQQYPSEYVDARQLIFTDNMYTQANVIFDSTNAAIRAYYEKSRLRAPIIPIVTGYIGQGLNGRTTTLGRNSSDYTATIIGAALDATRIEIWTDVDGIYSSDPELVATAFIMEQISFDEAIELSYFGAKVVHSSTFMPVLEKQIPILIKNALNPTAKGTLISHQNGETANKTMLAKSISSIDDVTLLIWKGHGKLDVSNTVERLFKCLMLMNINIYLILEGSPKHTICLAISQKELLNAQTAINREFFFELQHQLITLEEKSSQCIIAIIGDNIKTISTEISGKMFQSLGKARINVNAIVQGASDHNFSLIIDSHQRLRAINLIHQAFFLENKTLSLILVGAGRVGSALLQQLSDQNASLKDKKIDLSLCAITNSKKMLFNPNGIDSKNWCNDLQNATDDFNMDVLLKLIPSIDYNNIALIDCTASDETVAAYPAFIREGVHIITPNKRANVLPFKKWKRLMDEFKSHQCHFLCRTNVGAGLPILTVLEDLLACGDTIIKIEGIISGTLSYLFNHFDGSLPFSEVLRQTQRLGMTEPDPREDLSGIDFARKLLILGRRMGWSVDMKDIPVQNLVPEPLREGKFTDQFFEQLQPYDKEMETLLLKARLDNKVLRYVGTLHNHKASAGLQAIPLDHPLALSCHSDNIIAFTTRHYHDAPLIIRGPGAGVECTALGVFSDILKLLSYLQN